MRWRDRSRWRGRSCSGCATTSASSLRRPRSRRSRGRVHDNGGAYFVPAFSGLFAPHWRCDARGALVGLTRFVNKGHIARAVLEATAFQTREVLEAMNADSGVPLTGAASVDGGTWWSTRPSCSSRPTCSASTVVRPLVAETTALGAAYAAGLAVGYWESTDEIHRRTGARTADGHRSWTELERERLFRQWKKAVPAHPRLGRRRHGLTAYLLRFVAVSRARPPRRRSRAPGRWSARPACGSRRPRRR